LLSQETSELLLDYAAGRLNPLRAVQLEQHMAVCPECAIFGREQAVVWDALDAWEPAPVSLDFNRRLWQRIDAVESEPWYRRFGAVLRAASWKPAIPLTAAALLIAAGFIFDHPSQDNTPKPAAAGTGVNVEQVQQTLDDLQLLHQFDASANPGS
jgi:anti-sigma factor RsiW